MRCGLGEVGVGMLLGRGDGWVERVGWGEMRG